MITRRSVLKSGIALGVLSLLPSALTKPHNAKAAIDSGGSKPAGSITPNSLVIGVPPRISRGKFIDLLSDSDAYSQAGDAYDRIVDLKVDPLFVVAIFHHESQFGTTGVCHDYQTHSPGNTRTVRLRDIDYTTVITNRGSFVKYDNWIDGFRDVAYRLVDTTFVYAQQGATTPATIIPTWAPSSDNNNPLGYIAAVVNDMNLWADFSPALSLHGGFQAFYNHFAAKLTPTEMTILFGNLLTPEIQEGGMTVQYFERQRLEWHPGAWPEFYDVLLTRYAAQDAQQKGLT